MLCQAQMGFGATCKYKHISDGTVSCFPASAEPRPQDIQSPARRSVVGATLAKEMLMCDGSRGRHAAPFLGTVPACMSQQCHVHASAQTSSHRHPDVKSARAALNPRKPPLCAALQCGLYALVCFHSFNKMYLYGTDKFLTGWDNKKVRFIASSGMEWG
ncbi:hypothetical protein K437DRAFT_124338 [Tilletiaria anomala UBC 951]|uniref:Uncharacterized protein n=1 Tax=Tilletiaria anomala (strain ATCC 24038 / CBS 436.72 / UBC 951) TaxID=1037660 RepID=A0A066VUT8_TILAU|nr:uncharacterized protein K437DRAFT_124338 [Tilletiaria anomala UBC 951]KDN45246.1 hypothetical protein K437DRAFT_124338 [Tilletiaria anomala UBC 951]